jgi:MFS family permease
VIAVGASTALASGAAGFLVDRFGFRVVFLIASVLIIVSSFGLLSIRKKIFSAHKSLEKVWPESRHHKFHH